MRNNLIGLFIVSTLLFSSFAGTPAWAQNKPPVKPSPEAPFTAWLMNNEARSMAILANDRLLAERLSQPFGFLGAPSLSPVKAERDLWTIHLQYYRFIPEVVAIAKLVRRFGSGGFAKVFDQALPGNWVSMPMLGVPTFNARELAQPLNISFKENVLACMGIDKERDADLSERLKQTQGELSPDDRLLLGQYFESFLALFPNSKSVRAIDGFLKNGLKKSTAQSVASALGIATAATAIATDSAFDFEEPDAAAAVTQPEPVPDTDTGTMPVDAFDILK